MKRFLIILFLLSISKFAFAEAIKLPLANNPDYAIKLELQPQAAPKVADPDAKIIITNKKTGNKWEFTNKEFVMIIDSWENWKIVSDENPEITKFEQDDKSLYITFNYHKYSEDKKTKTSILSGKIILNKKYLYEKTQKENIFIGLIIGVGAYALLITIIAIIFIII